MAWDPQDTQATISGTAAGKVSSAVFFEDLNKALVIDDTYDTKQQINTATNLKTIYGMEATRDFEILKARKPRSKLRKYLLKLKAPPLLALKLQKKLKIRISGISKILSEVP